MKKRWLELTMAFLLLICFFFLSREAAQVSNELHGKKVIVVDAGHGGSDPGMIGSGGLEEKGINLKIAGLLKEALEKEGFAVVMTREGDEGLYDEGAVNKKVQDLQRRIEIIKEASPVLTVSIHQNSYQDPQVKGPQVFYYQDSPEGERLAGILQTTINESLKIQRPRMAKGNTSYYLLKRSPGVLAIVECGFLTNPQEAELLLTEEYQSSMARAIARGIGEYTGLYK